MKALTSTRVAALGILVAATAAGGCKASVSVRQTAPVANLKSYSSVMVRVGGEAGANAQYLEYTAADRMRARCGFSQVLLGTQGEGAADLIVDLTVRRVYAAQGSLITINNQSKMHADVAMVLSDGVTDELLGSAEMLGTSGAMTADGTPLETQAITAVADKVAEILFKSGCGGARVARVPDPPETPVGPDVPPPDDSTDAGPGETTPPPVDDSLARAEAINDEGKARFRAADPAGAAAKFEEAIALRSDPKYLFNLCLAREALKEYDKAMRACFEVGNNKPSPRLEEKTRERIELIKQKQAGR